MLQSGVVQIASLLQIHLATFNDSLQMLFFNVVTFAMGQERLHHWVCGFILKSLLNFSLPPSKLFGCDTHVDSIVHHIIHLSAKRIKRGNRRTPFFR